jgi:hypothetical protein
MCPLCRRRGGRWIERLRGRIVVLGIRGSAGNLCHKPKTHTVFRDSGGKSGLVLGVLGGSAKEIKDTTLTRVSKNGQSHNPQPNWRSRSRSGFVESNKNFSGSEL